MEEPKILRCLSITLVVSMALIMSACKPDPEPAGTCTAPSDWFPHAQTPSPNNLADFTSNCHFHRWSWQSFLWLTQRMPEGQLRFETFARPNHLMADGGIPPTFSAAAGAPLKLMPRVAKSDDPTMLGEIAQAGSLGLLIDQNGRAVYYAMYVNDIFYRFVRENRLYDPEILREAPDTLNFPVGALELKAAWKVVENEDDTSGYYTRPAEVARLVEREGSVVVDTTQTVEAIVALVGLHIAGVVKDHPEFIWATFEHHRNAPTLSDKQLGRYLNIDDTTISHAPVSDEPYTFYKAGATFIESNQNNSGEVQFVDAEAQTLGPATNTFLQYAQGGGDQQNRGNVRRLNEDVLDQLEDPVFSNYYLGGAIWLAADNGLEPNSTQQDLITGSTALSNVTMETFTQKVQDQNNCFSCHNTMQRFPPQPDSDVLPLPGKNLNISHILVNQYFQASQREAEQ